MSDLHCFRILLPALVLVSLSLAGCQGGNDASDTPDPEPVGYQTEVVIDGFQHAWGIAFLPSPNDDLALVTERPGQLHLVNLETESATAIAGGPEVAAVGQGGLLDVAVYPDFGPGQKWVYLSYSAAHPENHQQYATHVARARLNLAEGRLEEKEVLLVATPFSPSIAHFGSRLAFDDQWRLYITSGDRGERDAAQALDSGWGKTLRIERDGRIPADNPFADEPGITAAVFTYGHRNAQGMALEPSTGLMWQNEHGERNGDEINILDQPGGNHGWPIATWSREYHNDEPIGVEPPAHPDTVDPIHYWVDGHYPDGQQGFPPSGLAFYQGEAFADWQGQLLMGNLAHRYLGRFERHGREITAEHRMLTELGYRIRDVAVHQGAIYVLVDEASGPLLRVTPADPPG
ncbi:PQQ-dependent sugar dehydrogenase [Thioalkalivibrio paradoxus]|uniref:Glucose dehydrogenase n=1 Tax=Thioalkalivibrio paradoxus ARh 1 TaxID=713585 RepID=W0DFY6_9GAMM|nr:PQQ-dependent sugar dehydrogenase [Thioalkalivibrio paradoxus]AHE97266.1 glucose dehydrogenase [Thioalkalivibrio paradoxus ARh 1]